MSNTLPHIKPDEYPITRDFIIKISDMPDLFLAERFVKFYKSDRKYGADSYAWAKDKYSRLSNEMFLRGF